MEVTGKDSLGDITQRIHRGLFKRHVLERKYARDIVEEGGREFVCVYVSTSVKHFKRRTKDANYYVQPLKGVITNT